MKLLIITQKVDATDTNLGFFVQWIEKLAERADITVIANEVHSDAAGYVPKNVSVHSLGKERGASRFARLIRYQLLLWQNLREAEGVFFHMCPEYVLGAHLFPRFFQVKTLLWYVHKQVSWRLWLAGKLVDKIFTASKESCRLHSRKVAVVGHGIDVSSPTFDFSENQKWGIATATNVAHTNDTGTTLMRGKGGAGLRLITVGRISPVKDLITLIFGFLELKKKFPEATFSIIGEPITAEDRAHLEELRRISSGAQFIGGVSHAALPRLLADATVFVHASQTGSMDKAVLEALVAGLPVFTSSEAFLKPQMGADGEDADTRRLETGIRAFREGSPADFAEKISRAFLQGELVINRAGSAYVRANHSLNRLVQNIIAFYAER